MIKIISFDLDGTLHDESKFDKIFWNEEIPRLYARQYGVDIKIAKKKVYSAYKAGDSTKPNYYMPHRWFKHFKLNDDHKKIARDLKKNIRLFPETKQVLSALQGRYKLIVLTNSTKDFIKIKMEVESIKAYFSQVFSTIEDFEVTKKSGEVFNSIIKKLKIKKNEIVHVGDNYKHDYLMPRKAGIMAFYLDRSKTKKGKFIVSNLKEFAEKIKKF